MGDRRYTECVFNGFRSACKLLSESEEAPAVLCSELVLRQSTSLAQWFNKYHAGLEVMGSIPMGDFHI